ncbi:MAG: phosphate acyltransferase PlsX [Acidobacteriaceae bacterium]|jgi:glycerol-3-phosphate acyltransferase PlsX|nr:phosphate acyltransferase PlsX [Acidobacteriaceae bacterium]
MIWIAVDAMGGDSAPAHIVDGALAAVRHFDVGVLLVGPEATLEQEVDRHLGVDRSRVRIVHADDVVDMEEAPASALRRKPAASIKVAAEQVVNGAASGLFSAGHTGAVVMAAYGAFGMLPGVGRPALAASLPTRGRPAILLDVGASADCRPQHLLQFAVMGSLYARVVFDIEQPRVGLLSNGSEASKGNELTRAAYKLIEHANVNFVGNIEGHHLFSGGADVVVCDGFTGNTVLKGSEGLVELTADLLRDELSATVPMRMGSLLMRRALRHFSTKIDYSEYGGAPLLGVGGVAIVGHGRSSPKAVRNAVAMAYRFAEGGFLKRLEHETMTMTGTQS